MDLLETWSRSSSEMLLLQNIWMLLETSGNIWMLPDHLETSGCFQNIWMLPDHLDASRRFQMFPDGSRWFQMVTD